LTEAYGVFAEEAHALDPAYAPETVNTDGWQPTQGAWKALLEHLTLILCFLHAFLKIRDRTTKALGEVGQAVRQRVWEAYPAPSKRAFSQRLRRLKEWAENALPDCAMRSHTLDLCDKRAQFIQSYDHLDAHRTSNLVDRLMKFLDRACFNGQYFPWDVRVGREPGASVGVTVELLSLVSRYGEKVRWAKLSSRAA
jgi:hypothetical protein